jgi:TolA-binding protein
MTKRRNATKAANASKKLNINKSANNSHKTSYNEFDDELENSQNSTRLPIQELNQQISQLKNVAEPSNKDLLMAITEMMMAQSNTMQTIDVIEHKISTINSD